MAFENCGKFLYLPAVKAQRNTMLHKVLRFAAILGSGLFVLTAQQPTASGVFTSAQAEAGRISYEKTCGR